MLHCGDVAPMKGGRDRTDRVSERRVRLPMRVRHFGAHLGVADASGVVENRRPRKRGYIEGMRVIDQRVQPECARAVREADRTEPETPVDLRIDAVGLVAREVQQSFMAEHDVARITVARNLLAINVRRRVGRVADAVGIETARQNVGQGQGTHRVRDGDVIIVDRHVKFVHQVAAELRTPHSADRIRVGGLRRKTWIAAGGAVHGVDPVRIRGIESGRHALRLAKCRHLSGIRTGAERAARRARIAGTRPGADIQVSRDRGGEELAQAGGADRTRVSAANRHRRYRLPVQVGFPGVDSAEQVVVGTAGTEIDTGTRSSAKISRTFWVPEVGTVVSYEKLSFVMSPWSG